MTNETLSHILRNLKLENCEWIRDNIYYIKKTVRQICYSCTTGTERATYTKYEFLVIAEEGIKKAIILNCGDLDLHWYVFNRWRGRHILSDALRSGIIKEIWPKITSVTCCYDWDDDKEEKYRMTKYLASLAGLQMSDEKTCWIND